MKDWESRKERVAQIIERDGYFCYICKKDFGKKEKPTIDHWIPLSKGGTWDIDNLRLAHKQCNIWKGDRIPNNDGSIPEKQTSKTIYKQRRINKRSRKRVCKVCNNGRLLLENQNCRSCFSEPQPLKYPGWAKRKPSDCDHGVYHCFSCFLGFTKRII